jgi:hypothetical protein
MRKSIDEKQFIDKILKVIIIYLMSGQDDMPSAYDEEASARENVLRRTDPTERYFESVLRESAAFRASLKVRLSPKDATPAETVAYLLKVIADDPESTKIKDNKRETLAYRCMELGALELAAKALAAIELDSLSRDLGFQALAKQYEEAGNYAKALDIVQARLRPTSPMSAEWDDSYAFGMPQSYLDQKFEEQVREAEAWIARLRANMQGGQDTQEETA